MIWLVHCKCHSFTLIAINRRICIRSYSSKREKTFWFYAGGFLDFYVCEQHLFCAVPLHCLGCYLLCDVWIKVITGWLISFLSCALQVGWIFTDLLSEDMRIGTVRYTRNNVRMQLPQRRSIHQINILLFRHVLSLSFRSVRTRITWVQRSASQLDTSRINTQTPADSLETDILAPNLWPWWQQVRFCSLGGRK